MLLRRRMPRDDARLFRVRAFSFFTAVIAALGFYAGDALQCRSMTFQRAAQFLALAFACRMGQFGRYFL